MAQLRGENKNILFEFKPYQIEDDSTSATWLLTHLRMADNSQKVLDTVFTASHMDVLYMILGIQNILSEKETRYKIETLDGDASFKVYPDNVHPHMYVWECWYGLPKTVVRGFRFHVLKEDLKIFIEELRADLKRIGVNDDPSILKLHYQLFSLVPEDKPLQFLRLRDTTDQEIVCGVTKQELREIVLEIGGYIRKDAYFIEAVIAMYFTNWSEESIFIDPRDFTLYLPEQEQLINGTVYDSLVELTLSPLWKTTLTSGNRTEGRIMFSQIKKVFPGNKIILKIPIIGMESKNIYEFTIPFHIG